MGLAMVIVPRNTSIIVASGRVVCTSSARERASKRREPVRWLEVNPAIASKVDLRPQVGIDSPYGPFIMLGVVIVRMLQVRIQEARIIVIERGRAIIIGRERW